jgi:hypothetical protein
MTPEEARLAILEEIAAILVDLSVGADEDLSEEEEAEIAESMMDAADVILEVFDLKVIEVNIDTGIATTSLKILASTEEIEAAENDEDYDE